jgi:hypothetical protein
MQQHMLSKGLRTLLLLLRAMAVTQYLWTLLVPKKQPQLCCKPMLLLM